MCNLINTHTHTHTHTHTTLIPPWEDQCEWHGMTRMTGPDCAVMCSFINTHTHTQGYHLRTPHSSIRKAWRLQTRIGSEGREGANWAAGRIGDGDGGEGRKGDANSDGDGDGAGTRTVSGGERTNVSWKRGQEWGRGGNGNGNEGGDLLTSTRRERGWGRGRKREQ